MTERYLSNSPEYEPMGKYEYGENNSPEYWIHKLTNELAEANRLTRLEIRMNYDIFEDEGDKSELSNLDSQHITEKELGDQA